MLVCFIFCLGCNALRMNKPVHVKHWIERLRGRRRREPDTAGRVPQLALLTAHCHMGASGYLMR